MKKHVGYLIVVGGMAGFFAPAEVMITSPTGRSDEGDVVLEKVVDSVRQAPADAEAVIAETEAFVADEFHNTAQGFASACKDATPGETLSAEMIREVDEAWTGPDQIRMQSYEVTPTMSKEMVRDAGSGVAVLDVRNFFMGIEFPEGTSAYYRPDFNRLVVHQTPDNLLAIDQLMGRFNQEFNYQQVEIQTKFIEVEQQTLNELGFNWDFNDSWKVSDKWTADLANQTLNSALRSAVGAFGSGSAGTFTLTKDGWLPLELAIRALEQSSGANVLSSPSVTTQNGTPAEIWVGDREQMPTEFSPRSEGTSTFTSYEGWEEKNIGVHLKVTPEVVEDHLINLTLNPEVMDLIGYDTYAITPGNACMLMWAGYPNYYTAQQGRYPIPKVGNMISSAWDDMFGTLGTKDPNDLDTGSKLIASTYGLGNGAATSSQKATVGDGYYDIRRQQTYEEFGIAVPQLTGSLPVFRVRKIETRMTVADGSTVGMGGLIYDKLETYKDKVPILGSIPLIGRLFRSEGQRSIKRNLMIFVTATQVDVNGRRASDLATR